MLFRATRNVRIACCALVLAFCNVVANAQPLPAAANPIIDTTPYSPSDELKVIAFFKFSCPVCRNYHLTLDAWGRSLPKKFEVVFYPVLETDSAGEITTESARGSMFFWAVERAGAKYQRNAFADAAYGLSQDAGTQDELSSWTAAVKSAGISKASFVTAWNQEQPGWPNRAERQSHYNPRVTPSIVVCGRWMISPDSTNGDQELFIRLANGLVSKCMVEKGIKP